MNVRNVVVLSHLLRVEGFAGAWWTHNHYFDWSQVSFFSKLGLNKVDLFWETWFAKPVHLDDVSIFAFAALAIFFASGYWEWLVWFDKEGAWCHF